MPSELLAAQTAAGSTAAIDLHDPRFLPASISAGGLAGAETVTLEYYDGTTWRDYYADGELSPKQVTASNSMVTIYAPMRFRATKSVTASVVAIMLHSRQYP